MIVCVEAQPIDISLKQQLSTDELKAFGSDDLFPDIVHQNTITPLMTNGFDAAAAYNIGSVGIQKNISSWREKHHNNYLAHHSSPALLSPELQNSETVYDGLPVDAAGLIHVGEKSYPPEQFIAFLNTGGMPGTQSPQCSYTLHDVPKGSEGPFSLRMRVTCQRPVNTVDYGEVGDEYGNKNKGFFVPKALMDTFLSSEPVVSSPPVPEQTAQEEQPKFTPEPTPPIPEEENPTTAGGTGPDDLDVDLSDGLRVYLPGGVVGGLLLWLSTRRRRKGKPGVHKDLTGYTNLNAPIGTRPIKNSAIEPVSRQQAGQSDCNKEYPSYKKRDEPSVDPPSWYHDSHPEVTDGDAVKATKNRREWH